MKNKTQLKRTLAKSIRPIRKLSVSTWADKFRQLPSDSAEILGFTTFEFDPTATADLREAQTIAFLAGYRHTPTTEERAEMQAVFGKGTTVVDCLSGQKIRL